MAGETEKLRPVNSIFIPMLLSFTPGRGATGAVACWTVFGRANRLSNSRADRVGLPLRYNLPPFARSRNFHLVAVFGDGPTGKLLALPGEGLGYLVVGQRIASVFGLDHLLDPQFDDPGRNLLPLVVDHALGEEAAEFDHSLRGVRVLAVDHARNCRKMHADVFGDVFEHHRLQLLDALVEKVALALDYPFADLVYRLFAVLDVLEQIYGRTEAILDVIARLFRCLFVLHHLTVLLVNAQLRQPVVVKTYDVFLVDLFDVDLWFDVLRLARGELAARVRLELAADQLQLLRHLLDAHAERLGQVGQLMLLQLAEMFADHLHGQPVAVAQVVELKQQALLQIARGDARRVELLHDLQRLLGGLHRPWAERRYLFERAIEVAVVIEIADDRLGGGGHVGRRDGQAQLPVEVIGQAVLRAQELFE